MMNTKSLGILLMLLCTAAQLSAQSGKRALTQADCDQWRDVSYRALSPDGRRMVFQLTPQEGNATALFVDTKAKRRDSLMRVSETMLTWDGVHAVFRIRPDVQLVKDLRRQKKKKDEMPRDTLGIYDFSTGITFKAADLKTFRTPARAGGWVAYTVEPAREAKPKEPTKKKKKNNNEENGYTLVLRKLADGTETRFAFVRDYIFARNGQGLLFASTGNDSTFKAGVYWHDLRNGQTQTLYTGRPKYKVKGLSIDEAGDQAAFLLDTDTTKAPVHAWKLYRWKKGEPSAKELPVAAAIPDDRLVGEHYTPLFSADGRRLFFGSAPYPMVADTTLLPEEIVQVEVWHSEDPNVYPQQKVQLDQERKRSFLSVVDLTTPGFPVKVLADPAVPYAEIGRKGDAPKVLLTTDVPYRKMATWDVSVYHDAWLADVQTGERTKIITRVKSKPMMSPNGDYVLWFSPEDTTWYSYSVMANRTVPLTRSIPVSFADEEDDHPDHPNAYGLAGWTNNDLRVLLYDRYDVWSVDPSGVAPAVNLTKGRAGSLVHRYVKLDPDARSIDPSGDVWFLVFNDKTKESGYVRFNMKTGKRTTAVYGPARYSGLMRARAADQYAFSRETFSEFPDVRISGSDFSKSVRVTRANPQQSQYRWGTAEPVSWTAPDGKTLNGLLYKPEGFSSDRKYPMLVYFYERNSDELYAHHVPFPHRSSINRTVYTSNGYLVFVPDIVYRVGYPGESAYDCIVSGVKAVTAKGFVDEVNIGIQGHSWGGYQTAYILTRTGMFKAAEAGAIVANMVSAYGGVRWETGLSRMFQYEKDQSRIGATLWEKPELYLQNSPIFTADKITTPVLLLHNDADGAVPWYQGIEMYMALRRLGKPTWMLNYNGEPHWPLKKENRVDFQMRMMQFFEHYLKGAPAPAWMVKGVPALEKGINKGY